MHTIGLRVGLSKRVQRYYGSQSVHGACDFVHHSERGIAKASCPSVRLSVRL